MNFLVQTHAFLANLLGIVVVGGFMMAGVIAGSIWGFGLTMALAHIWGVSETSSRVAGYIGGAYFGIFTLCVFNSIAKYRT